MPNARQKQAASDLRKKLKLEKAFRREVNSLFARMVKEFALSVAGTGNPPSMEKYIPDWEAALKRHYERTQQEFTGVVLDQQKKCNPVWIEKKQEEDEEDRDAEMALILGLALAQWRDEHAPISAQNITTTSIKNVQDALEMAREIVRRDELPTDSRTLALTATPILKDKYRGRVDGILMFETQQAVEATKRAEAEVLADLEPFSRAELGRTNVEAEKTWWTVGDDKVRDAHRVANGQKKKLMSHFKSAVNYLCIQATQVWGQASQT
jgi:hypothetical protein